MIRSRTSRPVSQRQGPTNSRSRGRGRRTDSPPPTIGSSSRPTPRSTCRSTAGTARTRWRSIASPTSIRRDGRSSTANSISTTAVLPTRSGRSTGPGTSHPQIGTGPRIRRRSSSRDQCRNRAMNSQDLAPPPSWSDSRALKVLGMGTALPGPPVSTVDLLDRVEVRFGVTISRQGRALAGRLKIGTRHFCRDFAARHEAPRPGHSNPDLAAAALRAALEEAQLRIHDLAYLIGHTATPACLMPPSIALVADRLGFRGPYMELRQACTGFANALVIAQGLASAPDAKPIAIIGSETGSVYFDPWRARDNPGQLVNLVQMGDGAAAIIVAPNNSQPGARLAKTFAGHIGLGHKPGFALVAGGSDSPFVERGVLEFEHDKSDPPATRANPGLCPRPMWPAK